MRLNLWDCLFITNQVDKVCKALRGEDKIKPSPSNEVKTYKSPSGYKYHVGSRWLHDKNKLL